MIQIRCYRPPFQEAYPGNDIARDGEAALIPGGSNNENSPSEDGLCACVLCAAAVVATPAHADGIEDLVSLSSSSVTATEGDPGMLLFTLTNGSATAIDLGSFSVSLTPKSGDPSDHAGFSFNAFDPSSTCKTGTTLAAGESCNWVINFNTGSDTGETDGDFGVQTGSASQAYDIAAIGVGYEADAPPFTVTVNDVGVSTTPEPSSLMLLGSGLLGVLGLGRKRLI